MSVYKYQPLVVYRNLQKFVEYRSINTSYQWLGDAEFTRVINSDEYIVIRGVQSRPYNNKPKQIAIVLIAPNSEYASVLAKFRRMYNMVYTNDLDIMLIVTESGVSTFIKKTLNSEFTKSRTDFIIRDYTYSLFTIVIPEHVQVPPHKFASQDEITMLTKVGGLRRLQKILDGDPPAIWMGAESGDVIRIERPSESSGVALVYRLCIRGG